MSQRIVEIEPGDHICLAYSDEKEKLYSVVLFIVDALEKDELVIVLDEDREELINVMGEVIDVNGFLSREQLTFLSRDESFLRDGYFDPDRMLESIAELDERTLKEGYRGVRIIANVNWILTYPKLESLLEYEAKLNRFLPLTKCTVLCLLDERKFDADTLLKFLQTHPKILRGEEAHQNPSYIPPEMFLKELWRDEPIRKLIDRKLRREFEEIEKKFKLLFESPFEAAMVLKNSKIVSCNSTAVKMLGYRKFGDLTGKELHNFLLEDAKDVFDKKIKAAKREPQFFELEVIRSDGSIAYLEVSLTRVDSAFMIIARDVTERKKMEELLKESEERYRLLVDSSIDAIITIDTDARILSWNKGAERIYGYREDEIIGKPLTMLMPERFRQKFLKNFKLVAGTGIPGRYAEAVGLRKNGEEFPVEMSYYSWKSSRGIFYTAIVRDMTERNVVDKMTS